MKIQLIRNATMKITYAGKIFLTDPMLSPKDEFNPFAGKARNPTVELPLTNEEILKGIESVLVTHTHPDHFDPVAGKIIPKGLPVFCQPGDNAQLEEAGFQNVTSVETASLWEKITISRTGGKHGSGKILERMGNVSGFVLQAEGEPTVYWVGDSIWCEDVEKAIEQYNPDIIITHSGGATIPGHDPIIMDGEQTITMTKASSSATVVAIHLESLDHCTVSRENLREMAEKAQIPASRLVIPKDGETLLFQ